jgi:hypothetical protein
VLPGLFAIFAVAFPVGTLETFGHGYSSLRNF